MNPQRNQIVSARCLGRRECECEVVWNGFHLSLNKLHVFTRGLKFPVELTFQHHKQFAAARHSVSSKIDLAVAGALDASAQQVVLDQ